MKNVSTADLKNNLSAWLEPARSGEELIVKDRSTPIARLLPLAAGLMRLPLKKPTIF